MNEVNPYQTPNSELDVKSGSSKILNFTRFTAWGVFGLSIITLGLYPIYWMYTRAVRVNENCDNPISMNWLYALIAVTVIDFAFMFIPQTQGTAGAELSIRVVYFVVSLTVIFSIRNRLQDIINADVGPIGTHLSGIMTFFFSALYLQYKINEAIDSTNDALP